MNGVQLPQLDAQHLVHFVDHLRGNRKRRRTDTLLGMMRAAGFDTDTDMCVLPKQYEQAFNHHPCFRFRDDVRSISFLSARLLEMAAA